MMCLCRLKLKIDMTQEEKQLLLKDLCARLPYGVKVHITNEWFYDKIEPYDRRLDCDVIRNVRVNEYTVKPYLRPMSSMTEEEKEEIRQRFCYEWEESIPELMYYSIEIGDADCLIDWFLEHHFDHRGLIEKGLAIEAPEGMYNV